MYVEELFGLFQKNGDVVARFEPTKDMDEVRKELTDQIIFVITEFPKTWTLLKMMLIKNTV